MGLDKFLTKLFQETRKFFENTPSYFTAKLKKKHFKTFTLQRSCLRLFNIQSKNALAYFTTTFVTMKTNNLQN